MRDIELVIKIPEEMYKWVNDVNKFFDDYGTSDFIDLVKNGTPLSKGHGRIGDLDALRDEVSSWGMNDYEPSDFIDAIDQADTIIEADKWEEE